MISIPLVYAVFVAGVVVFLLTRQPGSPSSARSYAAAVYFGGLCFLPAEAYHGINPNDVVPPWIIGILIPTPFFWLNKAWIVALAALGLAMRCDFARFRSFRPGLVDLPIIAFCCWPIVQALLLVPDPSPSTPAIVLLLVGNWAVPWFLGRIYFSQPGERVALIDALILFSLLLMPISLIESISALRVHQVLYGPHPFDADGVQRYWGYRPLAFFEHGNQYGIWMASAAVAAWWRARFSASRTPRGGHWILAITLLGLALASQSVGAICLMVAAMVWLEVAVWLERNNWLYRTGVAAAIGGAVLLASGRVPLASLGMSAERIGKITGFLRGIGRSSLQWRIGRALDNLPSMRPFIVAGRGRWDWYTTFRPWDLTLMLVGFFGLVGLSLVMMTVAAAVHRPAGVPPARHGSSRYVALGLIGMAMGDALMNTYVFLPALVLLGSLPRVSRRPHRPSRRPAGDQPQVPPPGP